jgi:hypothetical protein
MTAPVMTTTAAAALAARMVERLANVISFAGGN